MEKDRGGRDNISGGGRDYINPWHQLHAELHPEEPDVVKLAHKMHAELHPVGEQNQLPVEKVSDAEKLSKGAQRTLKNGWQIMLGKLQRVGKIVHILKPKQQK